MEKWDRGERLCVCIEGIGTWYLPLKSAVNVKTALKIKSPKVCWKGSGENRIFVYVYGGNIKWYRHYRKQRSH